MSFEKSTYSPEETEKRIDRVIASLHKVKPETDQMIRQIALSFSELEVIKSFNQESLDFFNLVTTISKNTGREDKLKLAGYGNLFQNAIKINVKFPIDNYTLIVLEYADQIYSENEDFFMKKKYGATGSTMVEVGNEFNIVHSDVFKELWKTLTDDDKHKIKGHVVMLTTYAHAYFYQTIFKHQKK